MCPRAAPWVAGGLWAVLCVCALSVCALPLCAVALRAQAPSSSSAVPRPHFRSAVSLTTVTATVTDAQGRLVPRLPREQFEVYEDGELQAITHFTNERVPVSVAILLDGSDSMYGQRISDARLAIYRFVSEMLDPADEFAVMLFNHQHQLLSDWTDERGRAFAVLQPVVPWGSSAIYDAIAAAIPLAATRRRPRAAVLMVSDGADTASDTRPRDLRRLLLRTDAFVYAIGVDSPGRRPINAPVNRVALAEITDQSGGRTHIVHDTTDLSMALEEIADELDSQYLIGYTPQRKPDGQYHRIRVRMRSGDYHVRARSGYVADID